MKAWVTGILFGGFFGFIISSMAFFLGLLFFEKTSRQTLLHIIQLLIIIVVGWVAWKAEGVQTLVGYVLGSFYIVRLIFIPDKTKTK